MNTLIRLFVHKNHFQKPICSFYFKISFKSISDGMARDCYCNFICNNHQKPSHFVVFQGMSNFLNFLRLRFYTLKEIEKCTTIWISFYQYDPWQYDYGFVSNTYVVDTDNQSTWFQDEYSIASFKNMLVINTHIYNRLTEYNWFIRKSQICRRIPNAN